MILDRHLIDTGVKRRIMLLTQVVPYPPDSGPKIKTYNVLRYLAARHDVHLVSFVRTRTEEQHAAELRQFCKGVTTVTLRRARTKDAWMLFRSLCTGRSFLVERDDSDAMRQAVTDLLRHDRFDAVHADQLTMAQFAVDLPVPVRVLDEHNAVWTIVQRATQHAPWYQRPFAELEWRKLRSYEGAVAQRFDRVTVVSGDDGQALEAAAGTALPVTVIPIAVDTAELPFQERTPQARDVLSVATMFYPPNVEGVAWFAEHVFPRVREAVPGTRFSIVGGRPARSVARLGRAERGITVTGYVANLDSILRQSAVLVVPIHSGSGMRVKILEAFARGIPVVSTTVGVEGIDAVPGVHLLVADDPSDFAGAVVRLLREPATAGRLARAGRNLVESRYDWHAALRGLDEVYPPSLVGAARA